MEQETKNASYEALKKIIQAANPEITEVKQDLCDCGHLKHRHRYYFYDNCYICNCNKFVPIKGRPIRLADVLLTAGDELAVVGSQSGMACFLTWHPNTIKPKVGKWINDENILWSLKDDNLDNQSDECKEFLINLLVRG